MINISKPYRDKYTQLLLDILAAEAEGLITKPQARMVIGIILKKRVNTLIQTYISSIGLDSVLNQPNADFTYINYNRKLHQHAIAK